MKKITTLLLVAAVAFSVVALSACGTLIGKNTGSSSASVISGSESASYIRESAVTDESISASETTDAFFVKTSDGEEPAVADGVYTISSAGTYTLSGYLSGQIIVDAGEDDEVILELDGVTIECDFDAPIKIVSADKAEISAKSGSENVVKDLRPEKTVDTDTLGEGAIYAKCDLKLKGGGTLVVSAGYNNGVHTTKDLKIQKLSLKVTAVNNAIKGNDSVTVLSGAVVAISEKGDGIKTENTDADKKGNVRGDITLTGGSTAVYAAGDGFQAAHDFTMSADEENNAPVLSVFTGSYSGYTASSASTTSYKGVKAQNELNVSAGSITVKSYDDGLHCDYGTSFTAGGSGLGTINISGGEIGITVYSPTTKTQGGAMGPGGRGFQQTVKGADGIHSDYELIISGGTIDIDSAFEGLEGNLITVSGGVTKVSANDDGVNACSGIKTPLITVSGGVLDVAVSPSGDTDGIDSNGSYLQTGGLVIARGPSNQNMAALDVDERGTATISAGTLIVLGYASVKTSGNVRTYSASFHSKGSHTVNIDGIGYTFENAYSYGQTRCYSSVSVS